jgi:hypothetical protein
MADQQDLIPPDEWMDVDVEDLEREYLQLSAHMARAGKLKSDARRAVSEAKIEQRHAEVALKQITAMLYLKYRRDPALCIEDSKGKPKPPSEGAIDSAVIVDDEYQNAQANVLEAELAAVDAQHVFDRCWEAMEALKVKASALNSAAADRRSELQSDPNLRRMAREMRESG